MDRTVLVDYLISNAISFWEKWSFAHGTEDGVYVYPVVFLFYVDDANKWMSLFLLYSRWYYERKEWRKQIDGSLTFRCSPSTWTAFSLKSTPIVASVLSGNFPKQNRYVRHVLPTLESPITIILNIRRWTCFSTICTAPPSADSTISLLDVCGVSSYEWRDAKSPLMLDTTTLSRVSNTTAIFAFVCAWSDRLSHIRS